MNRPLAVITRLIICLLLAAAPASAQIPTDVDILVLGEIHDNPDAHLGQAAVLLDLKPSAVVFEMLSQDEGQRANSDRTAIADFWSNTSWPDYSIYKPIFEAIGDATIVGAAVPRTKIREIYDQGASAVFGPDAPRFGLDLDLPQSQQEAREVLKFRAHCEAMPRELMSGMVEVQRFRDAWFAKTALEALEIHGPPVAVITGNGHARLDWGIPAVVEQVTPSVVVFSIAFAETSGDAPFDEIRIVPEAERDDPCSSFDKS